MRHDDARTRADATARRLDDLAAAARQDPPPDRLTEQQPRRCARFGCWHPVDRLDTAHQTT